MVPSTRWSMAAFGYEGVEIGAIPMGTGNDYIRNYGKAD